MIFRARYLLVSQRTQTINGLRWHLAEYGLSAPEGPSQIATSIAQIKDPASGTGSLRAPGWRHLQDEITVFDREIRVRAGSDDVARQLMSIGIGPIHRHCGGVFNSRSGMHAIRYRH